MSKLKELREAKGISIQECSDKTGVPYRTLIRYEQGNIGWIHNLKKLAEFYNVPIDEILTEDTKEED